MKARIYLCVLLTSMACAAPRYRYDFGKPTDKVAAAEIPVTGPIAPEVVVRPAEHKAFTVEAAKASPIKQVPRALSVQPKPSHETPAAVAYVPPPAAVEKDPDLKRSLIFLAAGAVVLIIGGDVFVVAGGLSLLIGLIFGIKWLLRG